MRCIFPESKQNGCLFHFRQALFRHAREKGLLTNENKDLTIKLIDNLSGLSWSESFDLYIENLEKIKIEFNPTHQDYLVYYENNWKNLFQNVEINYFQIENSQRSNSILESWHRKVVEILPNIPNWNMFINFLQEEEQFSQTSINNELLGITPKK